MPTPQGQIERLPVHPHTAIDPAAYRLRIDGLVGRPLELTLADLLALPQRNFDADFVCLEGWTVPDLHWQGVPLAELLDLAGVLPEARHAQASFDDFSLPLTLDDARTALVALTLDGGPLPPAHGGPARLLVPGGECFTSVKWLTHLELRAAPAANTAKSIAVARLRSQASSD
jgi:DMSO/TMAO reductase YedYZ molybdopterin-dependent catalytic subunit